MLNLLCNIPLVDAETEIGNGGIEVFEYGCHLLLVALPLLFVEEEIELHGQTCGGCLVLSNHIDHIGIHVGMAGEIAFGIGAEEGQVHGVVAHVDFLQQSLCHIATITESLAYGIVDVANETEVEINASGYSPSLALLHGVPVLERVLHQCLWSDGECGVVVVAHLDGGESYVLHYSVDACLFHCYPVAFVEHVVAREPHSCHKS